MQIYTKQDIEHSDNIQMTEGNNCITSNNDTNEKEKDARQINAEEEKTKERFKLANDGG